jgi:cytochrome c-type biogenesis protein CcmH
MMLWIVFALLLTATLAVVLYPLWRASKPAPARADYDLKVYRAQLAEAESDVERGILSPDQAEGARLEIQRRMLAASGDGRAPSDDRRARTTAAIIIALVLPLGAGLLYASWGNPQLPGQPYAQRLQHDPTVILADAADKLSAQLSVKPSAAGYLRLAELDSSIHDYAHAEAAYRRAIQLGADTAFAWAALGECTMLAGGGMLTPDALAAFAHALELDAREPRARYYAGMAEAEIGNFRNAVAIWRDLQADSKPDAPWLPALRRGIDTAAKAGRIDPSSIPPAPASAATFNAAVAAMKKAMGAQP